MFPVARLGDRHLCPLPGHGVTPIVSASTDTHINFLGAARVGDVCGCGAVITAGFPSIVINHRPLAHLGSPTDHGGTLISGSPDTFGGLQFGGATSQAVVDFGKLGAIRADGTVDEVRMAELLADPQLQQRALLSGALVQPGGAASASSDVPLTPELIAVAGSQHDDRSGNKMMFVGQAVRELGEFKRNRSAMTRTMVVFTPGYTAQMLEAARVSARGYGAQVVEVAGVEELIDYLNHGKDRRQSPIEHLSLFSHGVPHRIAFGYQLAEDARMSFDVLTHTGLSPSAFSSTAQLESYACQTGMGNAPDLSIEAGVQFFPQTNESLAQLLADHLRIKVRAFVRRSDYQDTWGSIEERQLGKLCGLTSDRAPATDWCGRWNTLAEERSQTHITLQYTYQTTGASNPVTSGTTPFGSPGGYFEFLPK
ncbi:PAAR domain-containing protein [Pseudomonas sp. RP23018S]|uniref:PAAR domain-containing protein n=1 Tax=Pseudomonas sp. RP23018S TaxID=3096037 RepID=UPI002ACAA4CE|nr:PAAR domain-containing protein [Pseudomonas sp. RP23018S]MDZ5604796.1 PAAR domain-containing protein [Pseudomonas sp. RP23018S]